MANTPEDPDNPSFSNIRDFLGFLIGQPVTDITQHDKDEWVEERNAYVCLHFANGGTITIPITEQGFDYFDPSDEEGESGLRVKGLGDNDG